MKDKELRRIIGERAKSRRTELNLTDRKSTRLNSSHT